MADSSEVSMEEFRQMAERAGLGLKEGEAEELKPIYDLYAAYAASYTRSTSAPRKWWSSFTPTGREHRAPSPSGRGLG